MLALLSTVMLLLLASGAGESLPRVMSMHAGWPTAKRSGAELYVLHADRRYSLC